jgi:hypothetical protein
MNKYVKLAEKLKQTKFKSFRLIIISASGTVSRQRGQQMKAPGTDSVLPVIQKPELTDSQPPHNKKVPGSTEIYTCHNSLYVSSSVTVKTTENYNTTPY